MKIAYIGVPLAQGADRIGVEKAPDFFRSAGIVDILSSIAGCHDMGNVNSSLIEEQKFAANPRTKFLETVVDVNKQLRDKVASVISQGYFPLIVGGDHSIGLGSCSGASSVCDNLGVVWFDAHGDFNTEETSPSGNLHGMPCAALMGWCKTSLNDVPNKFIPHQNFYWIGTRDLDEGEALFAKKYNLHVFSATEVKQRGMIDVVKTVVDDLNSRSVNNVHLSIDIDGMDPTIIKGTGTRVRDGMLNGHFYSFLDELFATRKVVSADFVEYNQLLDDDNFTTAIWCKEALHYLALKISEL